MLGFLGGWGVRVPHKPGLRLSFSVEAWEVLMGSHQRFTNVS